MNHGNSLNEYINSIKEDQKNRTRKVIEKITNPMQELKRYNEYLDQLMKRNLIQQIEEVKAYFDKNVIELYYLKKDNINSGRKRKLLKIISSKQREIVSTQINKIHTLNQLSRNINLKYEANKETIYYYLFEQDLSDNILKIREENPIQTIGLSKPDEFTEKIMDMRKEKTYIDSIAEYLPISNIFEYEKLESQIEYKNKQNIFLSEMRVFIDNYFEFIYDVIHSLKVFGFQNYDVIQKKDNNNQLSLIEDNEIDLIKIAYLYIKFNYFRNDFIEEYISKKELPEDNLTVKRQADDITQLKRKLEEKTGTKLEYQPKRKPDIMDYDYVKGLLEYRDQHSNQSATQIMKRYSESVSKGSRETIQRWFEINKHTISKLYDTDKVFTPTQAMKTLKIKDLNKLLKEIPTVFRKSE